jgi:vitamin B12/bleomycin/antimicrobial peptide transport system ATP-binding/permease protein
MSSMTDKLSTTGDGQFSRVWALVKPYWQSEERGMAWLLLVVVVALNLGLVALSVAFNKWNNGFYNSIQNKDYEAFKSQLLYFAILAFGFIVVAVYQSYLRQMLQIRWRRWLTGVFLEDWLANRCYYRIELKGQGTDNPDQRIQEDLQVFTESTLGLSLDLMNSVVTLFSFVTILWGLSGAFGFTAFGHEVHVPGYMVWCALVYAIVGTALTHKLGRPLIALNYQQQRYEADMRYGLVRLRENAEGIAFYRGEHDERKVLQHRFGLVFGNFISLMNYKKRLTWFTAMYGQLAVIFPFVVAAPRFFSGKIQLGDLMQTASAFGRVQESLSWFIDSYTQLATWKATADRLTSFHQAIQEAAAAAQDPDGIGLETGGDTSISARDLVVTLPDGRVLLGHVECSLRRGQHALLTGPSGSGKSTLFRALAGIWPFGHGRVQVPAGATTLFLPQRPYLPLGTLRDVVAYPRGAQSVTDADVRSALQACGLEHLCASLDEEHRWSQRLSPGEQQRLAFARVLINKPDWLFLDEATSALDEELERKVYALVREQLPATTMVSIAHRPTVANFHQRRLKIETGADGVAKLVEMSA